MSDQEDKDSKTEQPTEKKINDALKKGQTASSREIPLLVSLLCFTVYLILSGKELISGVSGFLTVLFEQSAEITMATPLDAKNLMVLVSSKLVILLAPLCLLLMVGGFLASALQNEPRLVLDRIMPKPSKLSLVKGWSRIFGRQGMVDFAKSVAKLTFCATIAAATLYSSPEELLNGMFQSSTAFAPVAIGMVERLLIAVCLAMTIIAVADLIWSRFSWRKNLKMSRKELTDEHKQAEGDPVLKARMRSVALDRSRTRMMEAVPSATLIIANPTHISVALRFDANRDNAPVVVAKGQDLIALRIREIAKQNGVPVFERIELARALNKAVQVDQIIPSEFYAAVAELINAIYKRAPERN